MFFCTGGITEELRETAKVAGPEVYKRMGFIPQCQILGVPDGDLGLVVTSAPFYYRAGGEGRGEIPNGWLRVERFTSQTIDFLLVRKKN